MGNKAERWDPYPDLLLNVTLQPNEKKELFDSDRDPTKNHPGEVTFADFWFSDPNMAVGILIKGDRVDYEGELTVAQLAASSTVGVSMTQGFWVSIATAGPPPMYCVKYTPVPPSPYVKRVACWVRGGAAVGVCYRAFVTRKIYWER